MADGSTDPVLEMRGVDPVRGLDLEVKGGEILGIAGISGNGQRELAEAVSGLRPTIGGRVEIDGRPIDLRQPKTVRKAGLAYVPEERMRDGAIGDFSVKENLILLNHGEAGYIHQRLAQQCTEGTATIVISEDLDEVLALSDRIAVMFEGRIMGIVDRDAANRQRIGLMMAGVDPDSEPQDYCPAP